MIKAIGVMLVVGALLGIMLAISAVAFAVKEDERVTTVTSMLPGYNCGSCGYPGCSGMANALVNKETDKFLCKPCKADRAQEIIDYLANTPGPDGEVLKITK